MICELCKIEHNGLYGSGRFCSEKCARIFASRTNRQKTNEKISKALKHEIIIKYCKDCNKPLERRNKSGYCNKCVRKYVNKTPEIREKQRQQQLVLVATNKHKGWVSRNITSYPEKFFETVLQNNKITYQREKRVGKYFLDFVINNIDLEIDGKQHQYEDRKKSDMMRDAYLKSHGYKVYRITWNEINSESGSKLMKSKIDSFLNFLNGA